MVTTERAWVPPIRPEWTGCGEADPEPRRELTPEEVPEGNRWPLAHPYRRLRIRPEPEPDSRTASKPAPVA